ncbi:hypothetical protein RUM43_003890 [Polyplax serrata]|uniref:Uncharacterized protein n=1 Tax=Polyplax serrata TaxID=468196 RepID=A0AAN8SAD5_POLSC
MYNHFMSTENEGSISRLKRSTGVRKSKVDKDTKQVHETLNSYENENGLGLVEGGKKYLEEEEDRGKEEDEDGKNEEEEKNMSKMMMVMGLSVSSPFFS